ncbi:hypothetical protein LTR56_020726 [Elasticomyces elasticus]|nr:hypothetical protein LTR56_020726 [Elasticomyces elasticus]KAK3632592.1 hypothetical protein LTR22_020528 [Elasticomyces elasticus]KAK4914964.1 hypothetical protein LTR49_016829 [Elasticomyces elasticus]KAK5748653.1 hypothetical protein LTS12_021286 [Elasticomyces elasticus]
MTSIAGAKRQNEVDPTNSVKLQRRRGAQGKDVAAARRSKMPKQTINNRSRTTQNQPVETAIPAAKRVYGIGELFDGILKHVDMKTLLLSQRVSRSWKTSITRSNMMQKKLFLKPADLKAMKRLVPPENHDTTMLYARKGFSDSEPNVRTLNPLLFGRVDCRYGRVSAAISLRGHRGLSDCRLGDKPSWENMLLVIPPTGGLEILGAGYSHGTDADTPLSDFLESRSEGNFAENEEHIDWKGRELWIYGEFKSISGSTVAHRIAGWDRDSASEEDTDEEDFDEEGSDEDGADHEESEDEDEEHGEGESDEQGCSDEGSDEEEDY